jgi:hypothetical protein
LEVGDLNDNLFLFASEKNMADDMECDDNVDDGFKGIPLAVWPDSAPHIKEEYFVTVLCGEMQFRWALHEGSTTDFFPTLFWR